MDPPDKNQMSSEQTLQAAASFKAFLMRNSSKSNLNLYDHLIHLLMKVMDERPRNVVDVIEDMSRDVKLELYEHNQSTLRDTPQTEDVELLADQQRLLFSKSEESDSEDELMESLPNVIEIGFYLEQAGVGLGREETQRIFLALKKLVESEELQGCRLWGKILGTEGSYIVAEAEYKEGEEDGESNEEAAEDKAADDETKDNEQNEMHPLPESAFKTPPTVPKEPVGTGANRCVYYVCKEPGLAWMKLPTVSPAQIIVARQIRKLFTGRLDAPVVSYPPFPGNEANYLRAQIARISAGTQVSPQGYYQLAEDEEEDDDEEIPLDKYEISPDFIGIPVAEMVESLSNWVHRVQHILQQGRCTWVNLAAKPERELDEEEEDEETEEESEELQPEVGPRFLTPLSEDAEIFNMPAWTSKKSSTLTSHHAIAVLRSNLWPGACSYAYGKKFENIYVGWGLKYLREAYSPPVPPLPQKEYVSGPEVTEATDPTLEEEQALQEALEEQLAAEEEMSGDEEEDEDEDDDEEEDDDDDYDDD